MRIRLFRNDRSRGFTLIEIVISTALMSIVLASAYICLNAGITSQKMIEQRADVLQNGRIVLDRISADLRCASPLSKRITFLGMHRELENIPADNIDFGTHNYTPKKQNESDFCESSYYLKKQEEGGGYAIWRRRDPTPDDDPLTGGAQEEIAVGVLGLRFEYYDGFDWYDEWGDSTGKRQFSNREQPNLYGMPEAVRITVLMDSEFSARKKVGATNGPPLKLQTVARLNLAPKSQKSSSEGTDSDGSAQPAPEAQPGVPQ